MKKTLENLMKRVFFDEENKTNKTTIEGISDDFALQIRGGDRDYTPMYDSDSNMEWGKVSILLDSMK